MVFSEEERVVIKFLRQTKNYSAKRFLREFPEKGWKLGGLNALLRKIDETGSCKRRSGSGGPRTARTEENIQQVKALVDKHKDNPNIKLSQRAIARQLGIDQTSVSRIFRKDLAPANSTKNDPANNSTTATELTDSKKRMRLQRSKQLLTKYPQSTVNSIWFTKQKLFTLAAPADVLQVDQLANVPQPKSQVTIVPDDSVMVSVGVSAIGKTKIHFVEPGVKVNGAYYRDVMLMQSLLPDIRALSGYYTFQQDGDPVHIAPKTIELLKNETPDFISPKMWPPSSPDLHPLDYKIWGVIQENVYVTKIEDIEDLRGRITKAWDQLDPLVIGAAIDEWHLRLGACVQAKGGSFESNLQTNV